MIDGGALRFRERDLAAGIAAEIAELAEVFGREIRIMEVCGTHTVALRRSGVRSLLPRSIKLVSGPGCPVCVTPAGYITNAIRLVEKERAVVATFGDLVKVPDPEGRTLGEFRGSNKVRIIYSPHELLALARGTDAPLCFLGIGFETTIPTVAATMKRAAAGASSNLFVYSAFKLVPPALRALVTDPELAIDAFLLPGHVAVVLGLRPFQFLAAERGIPAVVAGFEPSDMLLAILELLRQLVERRADVGNAYPRVVRPDGNPKARALIDECFEPVESLWRGLGMIPESGLRLAKRFRGMDAEERFALQPLEDFEEPGCKCSLVIQGKAAPQECPLFGTRCTPDHAVGPCMISSEGSCAASLKYGDRIDG